VYCIHCTGCTNREMLVQPGGPGLGFAVPLEGTATLHDCGAPGCVAHAHWTPESLSNEPRTLTVPA
jgi:hypothetical protein